MYEIQGRCLQNSKAPQFMLIFDRFPPDIRRRLSESSYDLCSCCISDIAYELQSNIYHKSHSLIKCQHMAIDKMEAQIRRDEATQAQ